MKNNNFITLHSDRNGAVEKIYNSCMNTQILNWQPEVTQTNTARERDLQ